MNVNSLNVNVAGANQLSEAKEDQEIKEEYALAEKLIDFASSGESMSEVEELLNSSEDYLGIIDSYKFGKIGINDLLNFIKSLFNMDEDLTDKIDLNGDGKITQKELDEYNYKSQDIKDKIDANGDGIITQEEVDAYNEANGKEGSVEKKQENWSHLVVYKW